MNNSKRWIQTLLATVLFTTLVACKTSQRPEELGSAELWGQTCGQCHQKVSPSAYNDTEWEVAMHHMRFRAYLTAYEHKEILKFLQAAN